MAGAYFCNPINIVIYPDSVIKHSFSPPLKEGNFFLQHIEESQKEKFSHLLKTCIQMKQIARGIFSLLFIPNQGSAMKYDISLTPNTAKSLTVFLWGSLTRELTPPPRSIQEIREHHNLKNFITMHQAILEGKETKILKRQLSNQISDCANTLIFEKWDEEFVKEVFTLNQVIDPLNKAYREMSEASKKTDSPWNFSFSSRVECPSLLGYKRNFEIIYLNLISNAIKYNVINGEIHVTINIEEKEPRISVILQVIDTGLGIPQDKKAEVFTKSRLGKEKEGIEGQGIGLEDCKRIASIHNWDLSFKENPQGQGTIFTLKADFEKMKDSCDLDEAKATLSPTIHRQAKMRENLRVVFIDDAEMFQMVVKGKLKAAKINNIKIPSSTADAKKLIFSNEVDLIITDEQLWDKTVSGSDLIVERRNFEKRNHLEPIPCFFFSGDQIEDFLKRGANEILPKQFTLEQLNTYLNRYFMEPSAAASAD